MGRDGWRGVCSGIVRGLEDRSGSLPKVLNTLWYSEQLSFVSISNLLWLPGRGFELLCMLGKNSI